MAPVIEHENGRRIDVPEDDIASYLSRRWSRVEALDDEDEGGSHVPDASWKNDDIESWAKAEEIDLGGATKKDDMLAAIEAARSNPAGSEPSGAEGEPQGDAGGEGQAGDAGEPATK